MIRIKLPGGVVVECDTPEEAARFTGQTVKPSGPVVEGKSPGEGETLGQFRARCGLPGVNTAAAEFTVWRGGRWTRE